MTRRRSKSWKAWCIPWWRRSASAFLQNAKAPIVLLDIPLLFETGADASGCGGRGQRAGTVQRARVLARPGMTAEKFESLKARQMSDAEKRQQAHYVVMTDKGLDHAREQVKMILADIRNKSC